MTTRTRSRTFLVGAAMSALLAPLAAVVATQTAAEAASSRPHDLRMYKQEKYVALEGEYPDNESGDVKVSCNVGDIVVDAMWKVDHVDESTGDLGEYGGDERDVRFYASYPDAALKHVWHFRFANFAYGRAQVKLWVTCLGGTTEKAFGHQHNVTVTRYTSSAALTSASTYFDWSGSCGTGYAVAPGFDFGTASARMYGSWPEQNPGHPWQWWFGLDSTPSSSTFYLSCLDKQVVAANLHSHNVLARWTPDVNPGELRSVAVSETAEEQLSCGSHEKALVAGFYVQDPNHVWYLGMEPRIKTRSYKFWNDGGGGNGVQLTALCVNDRTGKQIKP